jgi:hypothetical protein
MRGFGYVVGASACLDGEFNSYLSYELTAIPGISGIGGYAPSSAKNYLPGISYNFNYRTGLGITPSGNKAFLFGSPLATVSYGIKGSDIADAFKELGHQFSNGTYDMAGRPYEPKETGF